MKSAIQNQSTLPLHRQPEKMRMHGLMIGLVLLAASLLVASSITAVVNFVLIAIPILTIVALLGMFAGGVPLVFAGIHAHKLAKTPANAAKANAVLLSLEGFWKHSHAWDNGSHPHFVGFQRLDHDVLIHLDAQAEGDTVVMKEFVQRSSGVQGSNKELEKSLEGLRDYRLV